MHNIFLKRLRQILSRRCRVEKRASIFCIGRETTKSYRVKEKRFTRLAGGEMKSTTPIFKIEILIYQLKASLDVKFLFGKSTYHLDPQIMKMLEGACFRIKNSTFHSGP